MDFGKSDDPNTQQNEMIDDQIAQSQADLEDKRDAIQAQQLAIIKSNGASNFNPTPLANKAVRQNQSKSGFEKAADALTGRPGEYAKLTGSLK